MALPVARPVGLLVAVAPSGSESPNVPAALARGAADWRTRGHAELAELARRCARSVAAGADALVADGLAAKWADDGASWAAEEWASGPLPVARFAQLAHGLHRALAQGRPPEPARVAEPVATPREGAHAHTALPAGGVHDRLLFRGYRAEVHTAVERAPEPARHGDVALVLGAGNVTSTPLLDVLHQVFLAGRSVLLKLSPLHDRLRRSMQRALQPLVDADLLAICSGDGARGAELARDPGIAAVHLTGSTATWQRLRADPSIATKELSAEVGCCTPVLVVPGTWRPHELRSVATQLAAYVAYNGGATCLAPRLLLTCADWPQRRELLELVRAAMAAMPARVPFHPGAHAAYERAAGSPADDVALAPVLRSDLDAHRDVEQFGSEHFAPVLLEAPLAAAATDAFLAQATRFVRDHVYGSLSAMVCAPPSTLACDRAAIRAAVTDLPHGSVVVNGWTGLAFGLASSPWGAPPSAPVDHGRGFVRGTTATGAAERVVITAPFRPLPLPPWLPQHRRGLATLRALTRFYGDPGLGRLLQVAWFAAHSP